MKRINTVVFDYDGTIHDTSQIYIAAFKHNYARLVRDGYAEEREFADTEITKWLGCTAAEMWNTFMPSLPDEMKKRSSERVRACMAQLIQEGKSCLFEGVEKTLLKLKAEGRQLVILSNCAVGYMDNHRAHFGLDRLFDGYFCAEAYGFRPKSEIFEYIKKEYGGEYCMVGDRHHDFEAGKSNGALTVGCRYGFGTEQELSLADAVINNIGELDAAIQKYETAALQ